MDWKGIIVNDGSTDDKQTSLIGQEYAVKYPNRFQYIYQDNLGLGGARNTGLKYVDSEYVCFLNADDWLMPEFVDTLLLNISKAQKKLDMVFTLPVVFDESKGTTKDWMDRELFLQLFPNDGDMIIPQNRQDVYQLEVNACRKVYRTAFLKAVGFQFAEHTKWEDIIPHFKLLSKASVCMGIRSVGFYYRVGSEGQIAASGGTDRLQTFSIFQELLGSLENEQMQYLQFPIIRCIVRFSVWCVRMSNTRYGSPSFFNCCMKMTGKAQISHSNVVS